jgi:hypothetical protein
MAWLCWRGDQCSISLRCMSLDLALLRRSRGGQRSFRSAPGLQTSIFSAISMASSISMPRYLTVLSRRAQGLQRGHDTWRLAAGSTAIGYWCGAIRRTSSGTNMGWPVEHLHQIKRTVAIRAALSEQRYLHVTRRDCLVLEEWRRGNRDSAGSAERDGRG